MLVFLIKGAQGQSMYSPAPKGFVLSVVFPPEIEITKPNRL
jgi:hypothetical protein